MHPWKLREAARPLLLLMTSLWNGQRIQRLRAHRGSHRGVETAAAVLRCGELRGLACLARRGRVGDRCGGIERCVANAISLGLGLSRYTPYELEIVAEGVGDAADSGVVEISATGGDLDLRGLLTMRP